MATKQTSNVTKPTMGAKTGRPDLPTRGGAKNESAASGVDPGVGTAPPVNEDAGDTVVIELSQHWTDSEGVNHLPGSTIEVSRDKAETLRSAGFAKPEPTPRVDPEPPGGRYARHGEDQAPEGIHEDSSGSEGASQR